MAKSEFEKKITKILNEEETFMLSIMLLAHMREDAKYTELSDLIFLFDDYKKFKQFIRYYEGKTIVVPTALELKQVLRLMTMFQLVYLDKKDFNETYNNLCMAELGLTQDYCDTELNKFKTILETNGANMSTKIKRLSKKLKERK